MASNSLNASSVWDDKITTSTVWADVVEDTVKEDVPAVVVSQRVFVAKYGPVMNPHVRNFLMSKFGEMRNEIGDGLFTRMVGPNVEAYEKWIKSSPHLGYIAHSGTGVYLWAHTQEAVTKARKRIEQYVQSCAGGQPMAVLVE